MTPGLLRNISRLFLSLLFLLGLGTGSFSQTHISSNANVYKRVVSGGAALTDFVVLDNTTDFNKFNTGDTVLLIQMKGIESRVDESANFGDSDPACWFSREV